MRKIIAGIVVLGALLFACSMEDGGNDLMSADGSGTGGSMASFTIVGDHLYTVDNSSLKVMDISTPSNPDFKKKIDLGFGIETVFPRDSKLFVGSMWGMYIYDLAQPDNPSQLSYFEHIYSCDPVVADENFAYITLNSTFGNCGRWTNELQIVDISDLTQPKFVYSQPMDSPRGLNIKNDTLIVCDGGLKFYKVAADRKGTELIKQFNIAASDVIRLEDHLLVIGDDGFYQYRINNNEIELLSSILTDN